MNTRLRMIHRKPEQPFHLLKDEKAVEFIEILSEQYDEAMEAFEKFIIG